MDPGWILHTFFPKREVVKKIQYLDVLTSGGTNSERAPLVHKRIRDQSENLQERQLHCMMAQTKVDMVAGEKPEKSKKRTSVVLEASRNAQKKASRTEGVASAGAADVASGLMTNDEGLEYVKLVNPESGASAEVYLLGGVVTSYKDGEGTEFIAVRPDAKMDGSKPISGGLSHCWPQVIDGLFISHFQFRSV
jgi:hypothetical protein